MLEEYIRQYEVAVTAGNKAVTKRIERELESLGTGMDRATLLVLVKERRKEANQ